MELFEEYFSSFNKSVNMENARSSGTGYADLKKGLAEDMEVFMAIQSLTHDVANVFYLPSLTTTGNKYKLINNVVCFPFPITNGLNTSISANRLIDSAANFITSGIAENDIVVNSDTDNYASVVSVLSATQLLLSANIFTNAGFPENYIIFSASQEKEAEKVSHTNIGLLNASNLTKPNDYFPAYAQDGDVLRIYPSTINKPGQVVAKYFRYPKDPKWTYVTLSGGSPVFDQSQPDYQDFELPDENEYKLVIKICQYCGISIREEQVAQFAMAQEQREEPSFSQQQ